VVTLGNIFFKKYMFAPISVGLSCAFLLQMLHVRTLWHIGAIGGQTPGI